MTKEYVIKADGAYRITDSRVSLDSIVYAWRDGASPETIADMFPVLMLEEIYGAITFYLANQEEVNEHLRQSKIKFETMRQEGHENLSRTNPELYRRLRDVKKQRASAETTAELTHQ